MYINYSIKKNSNSNIFSYCLCSVHIVKSDKNVSVKRAEHEIKDFLPSQNSFLRSPNPVLYSFQLRIKSSDPSCRL